MTSSPRPRLPAGDLPPSDGRQPVLLLSHGCADSRSRRTQRPARPNSVWLVAPHPIHPHARPIEPRLMETIVPAGPGCTRPGERVLPLAPPSGPGLPTPGPRAMLGAGTWTELLAVLTEAAGPVSRLRRTLEAHTDAPNVAARTAVDASPTKRQSAHRLPTESARPTRTDYRLVRCWRLTVVRDDCFGAVDIPVDPYSPDWDASVTWSVRLEPSDLLAYVTHGIRQQGRLIDPDGTMTRTVCGPGMAPLDRHGRITGPPTSPAAQHDVVVISNSAEALQGASRSASVPLSGSFAKLPMGCNPQQGLGWDPDNQVALQRGVA